MRIILMKKMNNDQRTVRFVRPSILSLDFLSLILICVPVETKFTTEQVQVEALSIEETHSVKIVQRFHIRLPFCQASVAKTAKILLEPQVASGNGPLQNM